jgi:glycosyltransferase involved in cell wall biosynthesis
MTAWRADSQTEQRPAPAASIIIPTYNRSTSLPLAVQSVFDQTFADWELVVVDDASPADVPAALAAHLDDPRVRVVRRPTNGGAAAARNTGIMHATGRYVCFLDDDDTYLPGKLAYQVLALDDAPPDIAAVGGRCELTSGKRAHTPPAELRRGDLLRLAYGNLQLGALLFRRSVVAALGFDESLTVIDDWDLHVRILERHRIVREDVAVARWQSHEGPRLSQDAAVVVRDWEAMHDKYLSEIRRDRSGHATWHRKIAVEHLRIGNMQAARRHLIASLQIVPWDVRQWLLLITSLASPGRRRRMMSRYAALAQNRKALTRRLRAALARAGRLDAQPTDGRSVTRPTRHRRTY